MVYNHQMVHATYMQVIVWNKNMYVPGLHIHCGTKFVIFNPITVGIGGLIIWDLVSPYGDIDQHVPRLWVISWEHETSI